MDAVVPSHAGTLSQPHTRYKLHRELYSDFGNQRTNQSAHTKHRYISRRHDSKRKESHSAQRHFINTRFKSEKYDHVAHVQGVYRIKRRSEIIRSSGASLQQRKHVGNNDSRFKNKRNIHVTHHKGIGSEKKAQDQNNSIGIASIAYSEAVKEDTGADDTVDNALEQAGSSPHAVFSVVFGTAVNYVLGGFVRLMLVAGNILAAWRSVVETGNTWNWGFVAACTIFLMLEYVAVVYRKRGREWTWWSPCFIIYLGTTLPLVWLMQLKQRDAYLDELDEVDNEFNTDAIAPRCNTTSATTVTTTQTPTENIDFLNIVNLNNEIWIIVVNESLVYLIIFARWLLPRGEMTRTYLADMLLEFLAIASDVMELLAIFDENEVRKNLMINYWILTAWSVSFVQFVPVLVHRKEVRSTPSIMIWCLEGGCGDSFPDVLTTLLSVLLQDGSFLVLRLYIMIALNVVTYSLTFFVMKNILSLFLLIYRLVILCRNLPCVKKTGYSLPSV